MNGFLNSISDLPKASLPEMARDTAAQLPTHLPNQAKDLSDTLAGNSEFLARLITMDITRFERLCKDGPEDSFKTLMHHMPQRALTIASRDAMMTLLRRSRNEMALLTAMADVTHYWNVRTVTARLSDFADCAIQLTCDFLLREAHDKGIIKLADMSEPSQGSGLLVLAMGKLGGHELNYSSDIDLIVLFDDEALLYTGRQNIHHFFRGFAQDLCAMLQERTRDGYVFRTDLRLRPDPRSTPLAVSLYSAITYYETLGQNWERAAMIKARPVYADNKSEALFARAMEQFIWRRHLDFAAINDIYSIKRQINAKIGEALNVRGHHVKLGRGGIREIEFFLQTQQLIWGGRQPELRHVSSDETLSLLHKSGHINETQFHELREAYWFLRRVEHYIQMLQDHQDHTIPEEDARFYQLVTFLGYENAADFEADMLAHCGNVHAIYAGSLQSAPPLSYDGNLVFTGVEADPETLKTLSRMGFRQAEMVSDAIQSWHRGARRSTRSLKARQILTEMTPVILSSFGRCAYPDDAFKRFDEFISKAPVGVQIFSLLSANPDMLELLAMLLGSAPAIGDILARNPELLDVLLDRNRPLPSQNELKAELVALLNQANHQEDALRKLRQFKQEKSFHAGVKLLAGDITLGDCGRYLSLLADLMIERTYHLSMHEFAAKHGDVKGGEFAVLGLGKLGTQELTFGSDLDIMMLFQVPEDALSDGEKPLDGHSYYQRFASRLSNAFTLMTQEGRLYELDMRLRPGGASGPLATSIERLNDYFEQDGWDVEAMGLSRGRIVFATSKPFAQHARSACLFAVDRGYDNRKLAASIIQLRKRISEQHRTLDPWNIKFIAGGIMDISLLAQYIRLSKPDPFEAQIGLMNHQLFDIAARAELISQHDARALSDAYRLQRDLQHVMRLCSTAQTITAESSLGLRSSVAALMQTADCDTLLSELKHAQAEVSSIWKRWLLAA